MKIFFNLVLIPMLVFVNVATAESLHSKYKGQENRIIKSLSMSDIEELEKGGGWGLAKAAELNGVPGPLHIIEMADKIGLSKDQKQKIQVLYNEMNAEAVALGKTLITLETKLNNAFAEKSIDEIKLVDYVNEIEQVTAKLRIAHLSTHLKTPNILTKHQIMLYNQLRGYAKSNPCDNVPEGHNPKMWKKHNGCS